MEVYQLGEKLDDSELDVEENNYIWLVYDYEEGCYDGEGEAVGLTKDGNLHFFDLGHCSCFGPFEGSWSGETLDYDEVSVVEYLTSEDVLSTDTNSSAIRNKVLELLRK